MTRASKPESAAAKRLPNHVHIAIIGSGFSGVGAAIKLDEAGHHDFVVLERGERCRRHVARQHLPGRGVRRAIASVLVLLRAEPGLDAIVLRPSPRSRNTSAGVARRSGVRDRHLFGLRRHRAPPGNSSTTRWELSTSNGTMTADVVIGAFGALGEPSLPGIPASTISTAKCSTRRSGTTTPT